MPEQVAQSSTIAQSSGPATAPRNPNPWWRRIAFWRAVAGMGLAAAIAAFIVLVELSGTLAARTNRYLHRVAAMNRTAMQLKHHLIAIEHRNAAAAQRASTDDVLKRIIAAPDLSVLKLTGAASDKNTFPPTAPPSGALVSSDKIGSAILQVAGFAPPGKDQLYRVWWQERRKSDSLAAEFTPDPDGKATVPIPIPPRDASTIAVTLESSPEAQHPSGPAILKGRITAASSR